MSKKRIMMLGFGGTIGMVRDEGGTLKPAKSIDELARLVPALEELAELEFEQLENLDSTNVTPAHWTQLITAVDDRIDQYDGFIITHGTDTMSYSAGAVALGLGRGLKKPVIFTGSQLPLVEYGSDAKFNLENSVKTILRAIEEDIAEVMIVFSYDVLRGARAVKVSETRFDAFESPALRPLAQITASGIIFGYHAFKVDQAMPMDIKPHFQRGILTVDLVPGQEPGLLMTVLKAGGCQGVILKSHGAGNVPSEQHEFSFLPVIEAAVQKYKIPVLVSTKFVGGETRMDMYEPGRLAIAAGAIPTGDMTDVMAQVKFMWALNQGYRDRERLQEFINRDFVGEITVQRS